MLCDKKIYSARVGFQCPRTTCSFIAFLGLGLNVTEAHCFFQGKREEGGESGVPTVLNPMPADERRVVHNVVLGFPDLESPSIGDGKERHTIIRKKRQ